MKPRAISHRPAPPIRPHWPATAWASALLGALVLAGCANHAGIAPSATALAPSSLGLGAAPDTGAAAGPAAQWWRDWGDAALSSLVERALAANPTLKVAQARLARAEAMAAGMQASEGLQVNGALEVTRQHFSATSIYPPPLGGSIRTLGTLQVGASWEFDFFGRNQAALQAALGSGRAAAAELQAAQVLLASQVARQVVQLGRLQAQRAVAADTAEQRRALLALVRQRVQAGLDTLLEQRPGEAALIDAGQQVEQIDEQVAVVRHALAALTAQAPDALDSLNVPLASLQPVPLPASVPADLLGRRADITAARWRIEAAAGDVRSARAQFYPNINLAAFVGLSSIGLDRLLESRSQQFGAGPALRLPIFDAGRLRANLRGKTAELDAAVEAYNSAVIEAVHEVADPLGSLRSLARQQQEQALALAAAESAQALATQRFQAGLGNRLAVLNSQGAVLAQRRLATDLKARVLDTQLVLVRALGGGYTPDTQLAQHESRATP